MIIIVSIVLSATVIAFTFRNATDSINSITLQDMPSLMNTFLLVRESQDMEAITPDILAAPNEFVRESLTQDFENATDRWNRLVTKMQESEAPPEVDQLISKSLSLHKNITKISDIINLKMRNSDQIAQSVRRIRRVGERLNAINGLPQTGLTRTLLQSLNQSIILLLVANTASSPMEISGLEDDYRKSNGEITALLAAAPDELKLLLTPIFNEIIRFGQEEDGVFMLSEQNIHFKKQLEDRLVGNKFLSNCIVSSTNAVNAHITQRIKNKAEKLATQLATANGLAIMLPIICLLCSFFIILYLKRSVIARMLSLKNAMVDHVNGGNAKICIAGNDELSAMGQATNFFINEIKKREERLQNSHDELEIRVQRRTKEIKQRSELLQREILERLEAETALRESETRFRLLAENLKEMLCIVEMDTNTLSYVNRAFRTAFKANTDALIQSPSLLLDQIHPEDKNMVREVLTSQWGTDNIENNAFEYRMISPDNTIRWLFSRVIHLRDEAGNKIRAAVMAEDITNRKNNEKRISESETRLKYLSTQLLDALEEERRRLAAELHDDIGPALGTVKFGAENVLQNLHEDQAAQKEILHTVIDIVKKIVRHIGKIQMELRPSILDDFGVLEAVDWYCQEYKQVFRHITVIKQIHTTEELIPEQLGIVIYRVVQESLNNIAKHSEADEVTLILKSEDDTLLLSIEDNGKGFDLDKFIDTRRTRNCSCLGLVSMRERIELSEGVYSLHTAPNQGTRIQAQWTFDPQFQPADPPDNTSLENIA